jgi:hypothetical protein
MRKPTPNEEAIAKKLAEPLHQYAIKNGIFKNKNIKLGKLGEYINYRYPVKDENENNT